MTKTANRTDLLLLALLAILLAGAPFLAPEVRDVMSETSAPGSDVHEEAVVIQEVMAAQEPLASSLPDFGAYRDVRTKKQEFFNYMLPMIRAGNAHIQVERERLLLLKDRLSHNQELTADQRLLVDRLLLRYRLPRAGTDSQRVGALLLRVDVVPASLVLAQSANESGWGTSRFAREANNLFGVWCFQPGCGLKPRARDVGLTHEVARYQSVQDSVNAYIHTINTNPAYEHLREIRAAARDESQHLSGLALAEGLLKYSARGLAYVREIQQLIRANNLQQYTLPLKA